MLPLIETLGFAIDLGGVLVIVVGIAVALVHFGRRLARRDGGEPAYRQLRQSVGRAILLGLELLVAGDIIRTVAIEPTFASVGVLAAIVLIRTFLSWSLEVELTGRWPWARGETGPGADADLRPGPPEGQSGAQ